MAYLACIANLVAAADGHLQSVYGIGLESKLIEWTAAGLKGYRGMGPVRVGNDAWRQPQHDVYGSVVLAATHSFFDQRLLHPGGSRLFELLEGIGQQAVQLWDQPDAGIWERRTRSEVHTFSAVMCWAACDRLAKIAVRLGEEARARRWRHEAERIHTAVCERAWSPKRESFAASFASDEVDASLLLLHELDFLAADDPRFASTVAAIERDLRRGPYLFRYASPDDFGPPRTAFNICTFWYIDALAALGRRKEARELFENMLARRNRLGLLSEDLDPESGELALGELPPDLLDGGSDQLRGAALQELGRGVLTGGPGCRAVCRGSAHHVHVQIARRVCCRTFPRSRCQTRVLRRRPPSEAAITCRDPSP